jgi:hypothetical protein
MSRLDFHVEVYNELPQAYPDLIAEAETRLLDLAGDQDDMIGASIALEELAGEETPMPTSAVSWLTLSPTT